MAEWFAWLARLSRKLRAAVTAVSDPFSPVFNTQFGAGAGKQPLPQSLNDTVVLAGSGGSIVDAMGNIWSITSGGQVALNGRPDLTTSRVYEIAYVSGLIWQKNFSGLWWWRTAASRWEPSGGTTTSPLPMRKVPPSQVMNLHATAVQPTSIVLAWNPPESGTPPFTYTVQMRKAGTSAWIVWAKTTSTAALLTGLTPKTTYSIEVLASNT